MMDQIEEIARAVCKLKNINPDAKGYAITPETEKRLGKEYPLWKYQVAQVELVINMVEA